MGPGRQNGQLGIGIRSAAEHGVADLDGFDALAHLVHHPGSVQPDPGRELDVTHLLELTFTDPPVEWVHARRPHGDANLTGTGMGLVGVHEPQDVRTAVFGEAHFLHAIDLWLMWDLGDENTLVALCRTVTPNIRSAQRQAGRGED